MKQSPQTILKDRIIHHKVSSMLAVGAVLTLIATTLYALNDGSVLAAWEIDVFRFVNDFPDWMTLLFVWATNIGTIGAVVVASLVALIAKYRRIGLAIMLSGGLGWFVAHILKDTIDRARPEGFIDDAIVRYTTLADGFGFPSGHAAVGAACAMAIALIVPKKYIPWLILLALAVGISRVYLGVHLPLDVVAGWSIGIVVGFVVDFLLRVERVAIKK